MARPIEIFRPGKHRAMSGEVLDFSQEHLRATAESYDVNKHEAPFVLGHPRGNAPAYGWVGSVELTDDRLRALPAQVDPEFAELVNKGAFKKVSASFYKPDSPNNPVPGVFYLRHVGFLGAAAPAVKGLRDASFADTDDDQVVEFSFDEDSSAWRSLYEWISSRFGSADAEQAAGASAAPSFSNDDIHPEPILTNGDDMTAEELKQRAAELATKEASFAEREAAIKAKEQEIEAQKRVAAKAELAEFVDSLVKDDCRVLPADAEALVDFMDDIDGTIEFSENNKPVNTPALDWFKSWLKRLPKQVDFAERARSTATVSTSDPKALAAAATALMHEAAAKGLSMSASEAVRKASGE